MYLKEFFFCLSHTRMHQQQVAVQPLQSRLRIALPLFRKPCATYLDRE